MGKNRLGNKRVNIEKSAILSADRKYRYVLSRAWNETKPSYSMIYFSKTLPSLGQKSNLKYKKRTKRVI